MQSYKTHIRYYPPHHFVFYPVLLILLVFSISKAMNATEYKILWYAIPVLLILLGWISYMMRQHYALTLQNRLVRLEMRHKYFVLTGKDFEPLEQKLSFSQIAALRFASDEELVSLIEETINHNLSANAIKQTIKRWKPDYMRV